MKTARIIAVSAFLLTCVIAISACDSEVSNNEAPGNETLDRETTINETSGSETSNIVSASDESTNIEQTGNEANSDRYTLSAPSSEGLISVESALENRRSHRDFQNKALTEAQLSQLLWAAYGVTLPRSDAGLRGGLRTAPSAGALYPLEIYAVVGNVEGIEPGVYRYIPADHSIERVLAGDVRNELSDAALGQRMVSQAPATIFYSAVFERTTGRYGERGVIYVYIEVGHSAQNVYLQAEALGLGTCAIGAFTDNTVRQLLNLPNDEEPLYLMPVGYVS